MGLRLPRGGPGGPDRKETLIGEWKLVGRFSNLLIEEVMDKKTVKDIDLKGKRVLMRVDFNVPMADGKVTDDKRIKAALPTIKYVLEQGASLLLASHLGRPKGGPDPEFSLRAASEVLASLLSRPVTMAADCVGPDVEAVAKKLKTR